MVINIGAAKEGNWELVEQDIKAVADACHPKAILKVIIETCLLTDDEKKQACTVVLRNLAVPVQLYANSSSVCCRR